jgi:hypothetical protein
MKLGQKISGEPNDILYGMENPEKVPKKYLYHMVPNDMTGSVLQPLNTLKESHPDLYVSKAEKYKGREHLMDIMIPTLECKWNDVLHFSPIHPQELKEAFEEAGMKWSERKFFNLTLSYSILRKQQSTCLMTCAITKSLLAVTLRSITQTM